MSLIPRTALNRKGPKYRCILEALTEAIEEGHVLPGERLPSHRQLARSLGVSLGTVTRAFYEALNRGLLVGEVGRGTFVRHRASRAHLQTEYVRQPSELLDLYQDFAVGIPDQENKAWRDVLDRLRDTDMASLVRSSFSERSARMQRAGAGWFTRLGVKAHAGQTLDAPSEISAIAAIFAGFTGPGDVVLASSLAHPMLRALSRRFAVTLKAVPMDGKGLLPDALHEICAETAPKLLFCMPTHHIPTAVSFSTTRRRAICRIARKFDVALVEDATGAFLLPEPPPTLASLAPDRTILLASPRLALSQGMSLVFVHAPAAWIDRLYESLTSLSGLTPAWMAVVCADWIESGIADELIERRRDLLPRRQAMVRAGLPGAALRCPPYASHSWLELPSEQRAEEFTAAAAARGVAISAAEWFAVDPHRVPDAVRICVGNAPNDAELERGLGVLRELLDVTSAQTQSQLR